MRDKVAAELPETLLVRRDVPGCGESMDKRSFVRPAVRFGSVKSPPPFQYNERFITYGLIDVGRMIRFIVHRLLR
jgi:hypothetical protein